MLAGECDVQDGILYYDQQIQALPGRAWATEKIHASDVALSGIERAQGGVLKHYSDAHSPYA